jgi:predicted HicB family RNase H-like nuclease
MARPRIYPENRVQTLLRLPPQLHRRLRRQADEREVSVNYLAVKAIEDHLKKLELGENKK